MINKQPTSWTWVFSHNDGTVPLTYFTELVALITQNTKFILDCELSLFFFRFSESNTCARERRSRETRKTRDTKAGAREEKRETARLARATELSVGLTTQNTIGWFVKRWQQTVNNRNHWQVDDGWSTAGTFVTFPEKKKTLDTEQREA